MLAENGKELVCAPVVHDMMPKGGPVNEPDAQHNLKGNRK